MAGKGKGPRMKWMDYGHPGSIPSGQYAPSEFYPNEPPGFTPICEARMNVVPGKAGGGSLQNGILGWWWHRGSDEANMSIGTNSSGEQSDPDYLAVKYPAFMTSGIGPCFYLGWDDANFGQDVDDFGLNEFYASVWIRVRGNASSPTATDGTNYENQAVITKLWYTGFKVPGTGASNQSIVALRGTGVTSYETSWEIAVVTGQVSVDGHSQPAQPPIFQNLDPTHYVLLNQWAHIEIYMKQNTLSNDPSTPDGIHTLWVDGHMVMHRTDRRYCSLDFPYGFRQFRCDPVWGGVGGDKTNRDDYIDFGHVYCSGIQN